MKPFLAVALFSLSLYVPNLVAQVSVTAGQRVRVTSKEQGLLGQTGDVIAASDDALILRVKRARTVDTLTLLLSSVDRVEVSTFGGRATGRGAAIGFGIGALVGGTIGYALASRNCHNCYIPPADGAGYGVMAVGALGAIVGAIAGSHRRWDQWEDVPRAQGAVVPLPRGQVGVGLVVRF